MAPVGTASPVATLSLGVQVPVGEIDKDAADALLAARFLQPPIEISS